jgi:AraC family transcriptional regulator of adaptative response / DNA-3-methyladenine glycosylase II
MLDADICDRALESRDARFDGVFFVGIRTTMIYCRPVCPARVSYKDRRRFFETAAAAERDGFRPCLRCRPELAPGRALCDAVPRVARAAAMRIAAGALNGSGVGDLASELGVGERQLRRAMERELGVSPVELAQTHRLLLAKCLLTDTALPVTRIAYASGFQSLRRFNAAFREHYRMSPSALRRRPPRAPSRAEIAGDPDVGLVRLTLGYRAPLAWEALLAALAARALPEAETIGAGRYARTVRLGACRGVVLITRAEPSALQVRTQAPVSHLEIDISETLLPVLMPLLARLRHLLDLDAEPAVIEAHLAGAGLGPLVSARPGLRVPGAFDGFEVALREIGGDATADLMRELGEPVETGVPRLARLAPTPGSIAEAGTPLIESLGVPRGGSEALVATARAVACGSLQLEPGADPESTLRALIELTRLDERTAAKIVTRALHWPDAFLAGNAEAFRDAEPWRPWRAYAAAHLSPLGPSLQN